MAILNSAYRVMFSLAANPDPKPGTIIIVPVEGRGQVHVSIAITPRDGAGQDRISVLVPGFLGFLKRVSNVTSVRDLRQMLEKAEERYISSDRIQGFFTMLPDMGSYRDIVERLGSEEAQVALRAIRDVVEAEDAPGGPSWLKAATDSTMFRREFLRTTEAYFAWKNAGALLGSTEFEEVRSVSETLAIQFQLAGRPNAHNLTFKFDRKDPVLPKRFAVIIGKNGVGKSQALFRIVDSAMRGTGELTDGQEGRPTFNRLLAFYPTAIAGDVFPPERRRRSKVWYRRYSLGGPGFGRTRQATADLVVELARNEESIRKAKRFDLFLNAVEAIERAGELALRTRDMDGFVVRLAALREGPEDYRGELFANIDPRSEVVRLLGGNVYPLSSGELTFVRFAALASLHIDDSSLLLFDEPETHLHPNFISQFALLLDNLLRQTGSAAIIATHSAYFVREAFEDQVQILRSLPNREISVEIPMFKTFGADVGSISFFVFGEDEPSRLAKRVESRIANEAESWDQAFDKYKAELSVDLLGEIRAEIEDRDQAADSDA